MSEIIWKIKTFEELSSLEVYAILKVRQEVFVVEQTCYYLDADGSDQEAVHIWAEQDNMILAYCRIFDSGIKYEESSVGRVLTHPDFRKQQLGKILLQIAVGAIKSRFRTPYIRISAQDYLIRFYEEFGFRSTGKNYLEDEIPHTEMAMEENFSKA